MEAHNSGTPCFFMSIPTIKHYRTYDILYITHIYIGSNCVKNLMVHVYHVS